MTASALLLAACGTTTGGTTSSGDGRADASKSAKAKAGASNASADGTAKIGQKVTTGDLVVEITRHAIAKAGPSVSGVKPGVRYPWFTVRVTNKGTAKFDATLVSTNVTYGGDGDAATNVVDVDKSGALKYAATFTGVITPGKAKSADYAYAIPQKQWGDVQIEVAPGMTGSTAVFTGSLK